MAGANAMFRGGGQWTEGRGGAAASFNMDYGAQGVANEVFQGTLRTDRPSQAPRQINRVEWAGEELSLIHI